MKPSLKISELFLSIQGEGKRTGSLSFFIRTNHCNLRCKFNNKNLCDTPYTSWNPNDSENAGLMTIEKIIYEFEKYKPHEVVITGGEPGMYPEELRHLCNELKKSMPEVFITIETNGTYHGEFLKEFDLISVSPKLRSSVPFNTEYEKMHESNRINHESLLFINSLRENNDCDVQWKFVYSSEEDIEEIKSLQDLIHFSNKDVYLMPEGISKEDLDSNRSATVESAIKNKWNYTDRLHILIWGNKRGV